MLSKIILADIIAVARKTLIYPLHSLHLSRLPVVKSPISWERAHILRI